MWVPRVPLPFLFFLLVSCFFPSSLISSLLLVLFSLSLSPLALSFSWPSGAAGAGWHGGAARRGEGRAAPGKEGEEGGGGGGGGGPRGRLDLVSSLSLSGHEMSSAQPLLGHRSDEGLHHHFAELGFISDSTRT